MFLSDASVKRPVAMSCLIIALVLLGINAYRTMNLEFLPKVDLPYITINTIYPGASPEEIETDIAKRIEDEVVAIDGLKHVTSTCMENACQTLLEFNLDVDVDVVATDVREKIDLIRSDFPADVEDPIILKYDINAKSIIILALTGDAPLDELYDYADNILRDRISVISGVANVDLIGGSEREVQILLDRRVLASRGLTTTDVVEAISTGVRTIPSGRLRSGFEEYTVKFKAEFDEIAEIGDLEIISDQGRRCYLRDLGRIIMGTKELRQRADLDGRSCVAIKVIKKSDANAVTVVSMARKAIDRLNRELPGGMELVWVTDDGTFTEATNLNAWVNVIQGIILTAAVLFLFLYNFRALLVVSITMPVTIIIGLFFMSWIGLTMNIATLIAIGMSVGILVTNSIVVLEAIVKLLKKTGDSVLSARQGANESFIAVLASAGTNLVVLFPISIMESTIGKFIESFAQTLLIMTVVSLFISFTLTPLLCSVILRPARQGKPNLLGRMEAGWDRGFELFREKYRRVLRFFESQRLASIFFIVLVIFLILLTLWQAGRMGLELGTDPDRGEIYVKLEFPTGYSLDATTARLAPVIDKLREVPEVKHILTTLGKVEGTIGQSTEGVYLAQVLLRFSEKTERDLSLSDLIEEVRQRVSGVPDAIVSVSSPSMLGGQESGLEMEIAGPELTALDGLALKTETRAREISGIFDLDTTVREGKPELRITPNRAVLADLKYPAIGVGMALRGNLEGIKAATFKKDARNYDITVQLEEEEGKDQVVSFLFPGNPGRPISLDVLADLEEMTSPIQILRKDKERVSKLYGEIGAGMTLGQAVEDVSAEIDEQEIMPPGYGYRFVGQFETMSEGESELGQAAILALILVILTLSAVLESFRQPIIILVTIPVTLIGMIWPLVIFGESPSLFVMMGGVMLIGIVVNNAILIMDQFNFHIKEGIPRHKAMITAATERIRPVIMITIAAVLGMLPMAFGRGIGAEMRSPTGLASAGGLLVSGVLTLLLVPIIYELFTKKGKNNSRIKKGIKRLKRMVPPQASSE